MTTLKQGDLVKTRDKGTRKVLGVCGEAIHVSGPNHNRHHFIATETELREMGYTWDIPAWEPENYEMYWFISPVGVIDSSIWADDTEDHGRKNFQGIYQTEALAEAALLEIKRKLGK